MLWRNKMTIQERLDKVVKSIDEEIIKRNKDKILDRVLTLEKNEGRVQIELIHKVIDRFVKAENRILVLEKELDEVFKLLKGRAGDK